MGENLISRIDGKKIFTEKTFMDCSLVTPKYAVPPNFVEKTFLNSHKTANFAKVFSHESFPLNCIFYLYYAKLCVCNLCPLAHV